MIDDVDESRRVRAGSKEGAIRRPTALALGEAYLQRQGPAAGSIRTRLRHFVTTRQRTDRCATNRCHPPRLAVGCKNLGSGGLRRTAGQPGRGPGGAGVSRPRRIICGGPDAWLGGERWRRPIAICGRNIPGMGKQVYGDRACADDVHRSLGKQQILAAILVGGHESSPTTTRSGTITRSFRSSGKRCRGSRMRGAPRCVSQDAAAMATSSRDSKIAMYN